MRTCPKSVSMSLHLLRFYSTHKPVSAILSSLSTAKPSFCQSLILQSAIYNQPTLENDTKLAISQLPTSQNHQKTYLSSDLDEINMLLKLKNQPLSALEYYESAQNQKTYFSITKRQADLNFNVDSLCVLIHILTGFDVDSDNLRELVGIEQCPDAITMINCLIDTGKRFDFAFDSRVFHYLLFCYASADRVNDAISCYNWMVENDMDVCLLHVNFLLKMLVRMDSVKLAWELYNRLCGEGVFGDCETIRVMMSACLKEGKPRQAVELFRKAKERGLELDACLYDSGVAAFSRNGDVTGACELLGKMKDKDWVPSEGAFTEVIVACVKDHNMVEALRLRDEMVSCGRPMNLVVATSLIKGYCVSGDLESALSLFNNMDEAGLSPDDVTFTVLIDRCCSMGKTEKGYELYDQMIRMGIAPSASNVNSLVKGFLNDRSCNKAYELLNKASESDLVDVSSYNILIYWLCCNHKVVEAQQLWEKMVNCGIKPNLVSYNHLLLGHCREGKVGEAQQLWEKMVNCGIKPTLESYNHLLLGYCKEGNVVMAKKVYVEILDKGLKPNATTFTILMDVYFMKGKVQKALSVYKDMVSCKVAGTPYIYNTIICGLCKDGRTSQALGKLEKFINEENFKPSPRTYNYIIDGFLKEGDMGSALSVYNEMGEKGFSPNVVTYTVLFDRFYKTRNADRALEVLNEMKNKGLKLDITAYGILIDSFCKRRDMGGANRLINELLDTGLSPNKYIYDSMISGYRDLSNMGAALFFHRKMIKQGMSFDAKAYTTLINGLLEEGKLKMASDLYTEMLSKGIQPDAITYTVLVNGLCKKHQLKNAQELYNKMGEKGLRRNSFVYNALIYGYFRQGNLPEASRLCDEMLYRGLSLDRITFDSLVNGKRYC